MHLGTFCKLLSIISICTQLIADSLLFQISFSFLAFLQLNFHQLLTFNFGHLLGQFSYSFQIIRPQQSPILQTNSVDIQLQAIAELHSRSHIPRSSIAYPLNPFLCRFSLIRPHYLPLPAKSFSHIDQHCTQVEYNQLICPQSKFLLVNEGNKSKTYSIHSSIFLKCCQLSPRPAPIVSPRKCFLFLKLIDYLILCLNPPLLCLFPDLCKPTFKHIVLLQSTSNTLTSLMLPKLAKLVQDGITAHGFSANCATKLLIFNQPFQFCCQ